MLKQLVEGATQSVRVSGEVRGATRASSGHVYFSMKDEKEDALIDCVMYRGATSRGGQRIVEGSRIVVEGRVTVFAPRGRLQLVAESVMDLGRGELLAALERLKATLAAEGLFDPSRKKPLPREPRRIAVLTSKDGAAIHDICRVAFERGPISILLVPTPVQGQGAGERIARALRWADRLPDIDVIVVTRGGGSLEDLAAYNDEVLVRAIAAAEKPVVTAIGHEIDTSLADLAADLRAATPSQAAEILVPDARERQAALGHLRERMARAMRHRLTRDREQLVRLERRVGEPIGACSRPPSKSTTPSPRCTAPSTASSDSTAMRSRATGDASMAQHPRKVLGAAREQLIALLPRLHAAMRRRLDGGRADVARSAGRLDALSPLAVLARGYAIASVEGRVLRKSVEVSPGEIVDVRLGEGALTARVESTRE
ncbi:MAG: exodeoxyribonuclease VII large subunit [Deltaproteobacteria bacterium]|nr:exodeoxyribonuclease VII large subunit [Deltaproteobacteria bacterium]